MYLYKFNISNYMCIQYNEMRRVMLELWIKLELDSAGLYFTSLQNLMVQN
ncbi:hypothetical protein Hanom_Chr08g00684721 [Helianthus anomalus]